MSSNYDLSGEVTSLRIKNNFSDIVLEASKALTTQLKPFTFLATQAQADAHVTDFSTINGLDKPELSIKADIAYHRLSELNTVGIFIPKLTDTYIDTLYLEYLLASSVCYVEEPTQKEVQGVVTLGYNKFLATRNLRLVADWLGISLADCTKKYGKRLDLTGYDIESGTVRYIKLNISAKNGMTVTVARNTLNLAECYCTPAYVLKAMTDTLASIAKDKILKFEYIKDNHMKRNLVTTLSPEVLRSIYPVEYYVSSTLDDTSLGRDSSFTYLTRGNVKVPELGCSMFEQRGTRTLNLTRILSMGIIDISDVDRRFVDIDLNGVLDELSKGLNTVLLLNPDVLPSIAEALSSGTIGLTDKNPPMIVSTIFNFAVERCKLLSTEYRRYLHIFMLSHPEWFKGYTGKPPEIHKMSVGIEDAPF